MSSRRERIGSGDVFYHQAKVSGWRARSAFKLLQIDEAYKLLDGARRVVDLCSAPGSWSQVLSRRLYLPYRDRNSGHTRSQSDNEKQEGIVRDEDEDEAPITMPRSEVTVQPLIVAVDLQKMAPVEGVHFIQGDITRGETLAEVVANLGGERADLIVCDGAPDVTGLHDLDEIAQMELLDACVMVILRCLAPGGRFTMKIFVGPSGDEPTRNTLARYFDEVEIFKPESSRSTSSEHFAVCKGFSSMDSSSPPSSFGVSGADENEKLMMREAITRMTMSDDAQSLDSDGGR